MANDGKKKSTFEMVIGAVDKLSAPFAAINNSIARNTEGLKRLKESVSSLNREAGFTTLSKSAGNALSSIRNVGTEGRNMVAGLSGMVGKVSLILGGASGGFLALARSTANAGDAAAKASKRAGTSARTWQEYAYAASLSDASNEQLQKSFIKIQDAAVKAFKGDKSARSALKDLGIAFKNTKGEVRNADNLFMDLAAKVQKLNAAGEEAKAANLVSKLLGEDGVKLLPMLGSGADGLREMRREAHALGLVLSGEDAKASEDFNDEITRMTSGLKGIGFTIGRELIPFFTEIAKKVTAWTKTNREAIGSGFAEFMQKLRDRLPQIIAGIGAVVAAAQGFIQVADSMAQSVGGWENVLKGIAFLLGGKFLLAIGLAAKAIAALGVAMLATPLGWIAILAGGAALIYKNWEGVKDFFANLWNSVLEGVRKFTDRLPNWLKSRLGIGAITGGAGGLGVAVGATLGANFGANLGAESVAKEVSESKTTVTERQEAIVRVKLDAGLTAEASGGSAPVRPMYDGFAVGAQDYGGAS